MQRIQKACCYVRNARKSLRILSGQTRKVYSEESRDDNADATHRVVPLRWYYPKRIRSRSKFEGVSTPRNEWNRRLRTKIAVEQTSRTSTSKREEGNQDITRVARTRRRGTCSHHTHDAGERWPRKKTTGKPTTVLRTDTISKAASKEGVVYYVRTGMLEI